MSPRTTLADVVSGCVAERRLWTPPPPAARATCPVNVFEDEDESVCAPTSCDAIVSVFELTAKARPVPDAMLTNGPSRVFELLDVIVWTTFCHVALFEPVEMIVW